MARPPRPSDRRGDARDRAASRRPGEGSGAIRRRAGGAGHGAAADRGSATGRGTAPEGRAGADHPAGPSRRETPRRRTPGRERDRPVPASARSGRVGTTAHPEAHRLTTRTDLSDTLLGPRNYTPRRIGLLAVVAMMLLVTVSFPLRNHYQFLRDEKTVAQERAALEATIAELEAEEQMLADPAYIEQQARIRFGAVKPGETPYRVSMVDPVEQAAAEQRAAELAALPWQTRVWNSIAEPAEPIMPEDSTVLEGRSIPGGPDTPPVPVVPGAPGGEGPAAPIPGGVQQQQPQEDPPA
ncbi:septum formation initiator family protein [Dietzia sp. ANT_WB102]|uniref:FtsB family cell division protein n=1 Tax=Dietzia sp. ANT_WB102 TaxID=2597345 RepID=UPI0011ED389C|nr:septum formation initiator family protein [Dietzia sp. ANT_WB102]KAA0919247.1 septum formation initiator family protein [Dietzia sp. ANT_WB102]